MTAIVAFVALGSMVPTAAHAQEAYPPDGAVGLVLDPAVCTSNGLHGFVHGAVVGSSVHFSIVYPNLSTSADSIADAQGHADLTTTIPVPRPSGVTVTASGQSPTGPFTVGAFSLTSVVSFAACPEGTTVPSQEGIAIPNTGADVTPWMRIGGASVGAGALIVVAIRRRRRTPRQSLAN